MKKILSLVAVSALGGALTLGAYLFLIQGQPVIQQEVKNEIPVFQANYSGLAATPAEETDFTKIANNAVHAVVHVKNVSLAPSNPNSIFEFFYGNQGGGNRQQMVVGTGSGVIISPDGYIITNNHVIKGAKKLEVTLNNSTIYPAEIVGVDESTDIALIKIDAKDLPVMTFGDSDNLKVGEWVLAVGNPFNLTSTVTAGIVSAKARNINISRNVNHIESFIQTDAAVNPGNSGGALVNTRGELIGINTAISSQTGSYIGYSFAVPANIAKKVVEDILEFGNVQRAYLGINYEELDSQKAADFGVNATDGVIVTRVIEQGAAAEAGLKANDVIKSMDNVTISKFSDLQGFLGSKRPGDQVQVKVLRNDNEKEFTVKLKNQFGKFSYGNTDFSEYYFGDLIPIPNSDQRKFDISYGVKISKLKNLELQQTYGIESGDIILSVEDVNVKSEKEVERLLKKYQNKDYVVIKMLTQRGKLGYIRLRAN